MKKGHLHEFLTEYAAGDNLRLHTPGHKGKLCDIDITELDGVFPDAQIEAAERDIAAAYNAKHARLLACGSSQGVKAAVYFAAANGIADVNSHRSVFDGFKLSGKTVKTVGRRGDVRPITVKDIDGALTPDIGCVVVTSPTYYGFVADVDGIADYCKRKGLLFIVDGAHGAHFGFSPLLPKAFADKCDICNVSAHKTLKAFTQGAILLDNLSERKSDKLFEAVKIMGTTSPSYPLYASIEDAVIAARSDEKAYAALYGPIGELRGRFPFLKNDDFTRLVLDCERAGVSPKELNATLVGKGVYSELVTDKYIVFLFTAADSAENVQRLYAALRACI
ncbi:MAG: hypothetical protein J1G38_04845 [Clostridiales bacterium]|nr:hypothetical protein [Clostridiales bacterium]